MAFPSWHPDFLIFNDSIIGESFGSPRFATVRLQNETGEARRGFRDVPLWSLDLSGLLLSAHQYDELLAFQWEVEGMLNPFLVRNARNCVFEDARGYPSLLGMGNGAQTQFQLQKTRGTQGRSSREIIRYPNWNYPPLEDLNGHDWTFLPPLRMFVGGLGDGISRGTEVTNTMTVDRSLGTVLLTNAPASGQRIEAYGGFYSLMTSNVDEIPVKLEAGVFKVQQGISFSEPAGGQ